MLTWLLPFALTFAPLLGCDDGETATADAIAGEDSGPIIGRDMRPGPMADAEVDMAPSEADISIEPRALTLLADPGVASAPGLITIRNVGGLPLSISRVAVEGEGSPFAVVDGPVGPVVLAGGESLAVEVVFTPGGEELVMGALTVVSDDPDESPLSLPLTGRIRQSCLRAMPSTVNVGEVAPGGESPRFSVRVVNCGDRAVEIGEVALAGDEGFDFVIEQGSANATLAAGGTLGLAVWYRNTALPVGEVAATVLSVGTDLVSGALAVNVSARGGSGPSCVVTVAPVMVDFETLRLGATREVELVVGNAGSADCEVRSLGVEPTAGPVENEFRVARGIGGGVAGGERGDDRGGLCADGAESIGGSGRAAVVVSRSGAGSESAGDGAVAGGGGGGVDRGRSGDGGVWGGYGGVRVVGAGGAGSECGVRADLRLGVPVRGRGVRAVRGGGGAGVWRGVHGAGAG